jgi:hypothetical protein
MSTTLPAEDLTRSQTETRALRMLAAGDDVKDVVLATGLSREEVDKLRRDFPTTSPAVVPPPTTAPQQDPIGRLISLGARQGAPKRAQALAAKIAADVDRLRGLLAAEAETEAKKRAEAEAKEAARAEVKRLEAQLRMAKAKLRSGKPTVKAPTSTTGPKVCADCGKPVVREPGQMGATPRRCKDCRG